MSIKKQQKKRKNAQRAEEDTLRSCKVLKRTGKKSQDSEWGSNNAMKGKN